MNATLNVKVENWPIAGGFTISRGTKTEAVVVVAEISRGGHTGRGECVPYARYGESVEDVARRISAMSPAIEDGLDRQALRSALPAGAARNALDCALWDLEARESGRRVSEIANLPEPKPLVTAYTLSLGSPEEMAVAARKAADRPLIKVKLGGAGDEDRILAVRENAPRARLIVDANEAWQVNELEAMLAACGRAAIELVEQPLPADADEALSSIYRPVPVCADESAHDRASLARLSGRYDAVNIKLDKTGGLTEALDMADAAREAGLRIMVGCMLATSLAMAPALMVAQTAQWVDLDGPLLLSQDREPGLVYEGSLVHPPTADLWG